MHVRARVQIRGVCSFVRIIISYRMIMTTAVIDVVVKIVIVCMRARIILLN